MNDDVVEKCLTRRPFEELTPIHPEERFTLERPSASRDLAIRLIDMIAPIGKGQRGLVVSPPKAGKTIMLKKIANSITANYPKVNLIVLLMAIELMLLAVNMNFIAFSHYLGDIAGQVFVFFILTVAAAESAIGLAILIVMFRNMRTIHVDDLDSLKG